MADHERRAHGGLGANVRGCGTGCVTFDLQLGGVPDLGGRIAGDARKVAGVPRVEAGNAEEARIGVKGRHVCAQRGGQRMAVLQPGDDQRLVAGANAAHRTGSHAFREPVLKGKGLDNGRN